MRIQWGDFDAAISASITLTPGIDPDELQMTIGAPIDGNTLANIRVVTLPASGTLQNNLTAVIPDQLISLTDLNNGNFKFIPNADENGSPYTSFQFTVLDNNSEESTSEVLTINVNPQNDPPTAQSKTMAGVEDTPLVILFRWIRSLPATQPVHVLLVCQGSSYPM